MYRILIFTVVIAFSFLFNWIYNSNSLADIDFDEVVSLQKIDKLESISSCGISGNNPFMTFIDIDTDSVEIVRTFLYPLHSPKSFYVAGTSFTDTEVTAQICEEFLCNLFYDIFEFENGIRGDRLNTCLYEGDLD
jgi:hypothetical protein